MPSPSTTTAAASGPTQLSFVNRLRFFTPTVVYLAIYLTLATLNFGYDVGSFSGVQAITPFLQRFGGLDTEKDQWVLPSYLSSVMNSTPFIGKLLGALACGPVAERFGRRIAMLVMSMISLVGVTLQTSATTAAQFTIGRIVNYAMTGFCIVVVPIYQAECTPPELRGMISSTIQFSILFGQVIASLVNLGTKQLQGQTAWQIPVGLQFIVPILMLAFLPFMPESPRWLISKGRTMQAKQALCRLRHTSADEDVEAELYAWEQFKGNDGKGTWRELFSKKYRIRTWIAIMVMFFQQITGQAFVSQYGVTFYKTNKIGSPFLLGVLQNVVAMILNFFTMVTADSIGRRPLLLTGSSLMAAFLFSLAGVGSTQPYSEPAKRSMAACMILFNGFYGLSWAPISYIVLGEVASARVKEKTNNLAVIISVFTTFVVSFTVPYLLNGPYAALGPKVGYIYGSFTLLSVGCAYFFVPELKGRALEEIDELFDSKISLMRFKNAQVETVVQIEASFESSKSKDGIGRVE